MSPRISPSIELLPTLDDCSVVEGSQARTNHILTDWGGCGTARQGPQRRPTARTRAASHSGWGTTDIGIIIAQKAWLELALHTRGAINNGLTEVEIREAVLQATVYCGTPAGVEAMMVTEKTINEMIEQGEYSRPKQ